MYARFKGQDLISVDELTKEDILFLIETARTLRDSPQPALLKGCILGSCFFEPSTRTRLSFESAMSRLGGSSIGFADASETSIKKGESLSDTIRMMGCYADVIVLRHPADGAARLAAESTDKPVINAGDGAREHPTQTLVDLFSMAESQQRLESLSIGFLGDLRLGRTVHSLARGCALFGHRLYFISPPQLEMPQSICDNLRVKEACYSFHTDASEVIDRLDVLYVTRFQKERAESGTAPAYTVTKELLRDAQATLKIMAPLPRLSELPRGLDALPQSYYFQQAQNGLYVREALLALTLGRLP